MSDPNYKPPPGYLGNLNKTQEDALEQLKKELKEEGKFVAERMDDATLLRFLRARKFDVALAKKMLLDAEEWRRDFGVDNLVKNFDFKEKEEVSKYYPQFYHKTDKAGRPIYIERFNNLDITALHNCTTFDRLLKRLVIEYEKSFSTRLPACSSAVGHPVESFCTILDLGHIGLGNFYRVKDYVMSAAAVGQDRYPETMGKFFIVNAPWTFSTVWMLVKPWLDEVTVRKIDISRDANTAKLLESIDADCLPKDLGGTCNCPGGCDKSDAGPWKAA
ncbi:sec14 cytosolic factor [Moniliophthora roreri MCA 2997]|uniref:Sec14 cytosolic factor n=2 Tax=Moniliophthora roreri TaxID=221103 RepID=V2X892_MONRO|nr:sec14 cytosolic factor [Moniliophthora roreri MCA 2997]KAI3611477.1 sec14 cytosolic factor [Moniliophthora roreri]